MLKHLSLRRHAAAATRAVRRDTKGEIRDRRERFFDAARDETPMLAVESEHGAFLVHTADVRIGRRVFIKGHFAGNLLQQALSVLERTGFEHVREGALLDIGANIGTIAIPAVHRHGMSRAVAFEPHPDNVRLLRMNVIFNDLDARVDVLACALSDHDGIGRLEVVNARNSGAHEVAEPGRVRPELDSVDIELRTLDSLEQEGRLALDDVTLAFLDVQGHEPRVLAGATRMLARGTPVVAEFQPAVLRRNGTLDTMLALATGHFESFVDLHTKSDVPVVEPIAQLSASADRLGDGYTDLLLLPSRD